MKNHSAHNYFFRIYFKEEIIDEVEIEAEITDIFYGPSLLAVHNDTLCSEDDLFLLPVTITPSIVIAASPAPAGQFTFR